MPAPQPETLPDVSGRLWPGSRLSGRPSAGAYAVLPSASDPRFLLPADPRLARAALRARTTPTHRTERLRNELLGLGLRWGGRRLIVRDYVVPDGSSVIDHVADVLGVPLSAAVHLGPPRSNRKPVLTLLGADGEVVAYAKIGVNELTSSLVRHEGDALELLARGPLTGVRMPKVLNRSVWHGLDVLVLEALELSSSGPLPAESLVVASGAIAAATGTDVRPVARVVDDLLDGSRDVHAPGTEEVRTFLRELRERDGRLGVVCGGWHGDFAPGNVAGSGNRDVVVIDFERHQRAGIPVGSDLLHYRIRQLNHSEGLSTDAAIGQAAQECTALLGRAGVEADSARNVLRLYLARILLRYLGDGQSMVADPRRSVRPWLGLVA